MRAHVRSFVVAALLTTLIGACELSPSAAPTPTSSSRDACAPTTSPIPSATPTTAASDIRINGVVRSRETCAPIAGVEVEAFEGHGGAVTLGARGSAVTDKSGVFAIRVPAGKYRLLFTPPKGSEFASRWWLRESSYLAATSVEEDSEGIVMLLPRGVSISGRVIADTGGPMPNAYIRVSPSSNYYDLAATSMSDANGHYTVMVAPGDYRLQFFAPPLWASQWWDNRSSHADSDVVIVPKDVTGISVMLRAGRTLRGRLTSASSSPVAGGYVVAVLPTTTNWCCEFAGYGIIDSNGLFRFAVPEGTYRVGFIFSDNDDHLIVLWWPGPTFDVEQAGAIVVDRDRTGIDLALP